jgi:hypothetical protein
MVILSKIQKPKTKQDLAKAITQANISSFDIYEGDEINRLPSKADLARSKPTIIVIRSK